MALLELGQQHEDLAAAPRLAGRQLATQIKQQRFVIHEARHDYSESVYRIAGRPVVGSVWLPIRSNALIFVTRS